MKRFFFQLYITWGHLVLYQNCPSGISLILLLCKVKTLSLLVQVVDGMNSELLLIRLIQTWYSHTLQYFLDPPCNCYLRCNRFIATSSLKRLMLSEAQNIQTHHQVMVAVTTDTFSCTKPSPNTSAALGLPTEAFLFCREPVLGIVLFVTSQMYFVPNYGHVGEMTFICLSF